MSLAALVHDGRRGRLALQLLMATQGAISVLAGSKSIKMRRNVDDTDVPCDAQ